ncbi:MAG: hypothetical protein AMXMBFR57_23530 [Acidimicrobiia bacterium]
MGSNPTLSAIINSRRVNQLQEDELLTSREEDPSTPISARLADIDVACVAQSGRRVYYGTLADLITSPEEAQAAGRLQARLKVLTHPAVLVVDEIGYLPITRTGVQQRL